MKKILSYWAPIFVYMAGILVLSLAPEAQTPQILEIDKILHLGAYGVMAILWLRAFDTLKIGAKTALLISVSIVIVFGATIEFAQGYVPERKASLADGLANAVGAFAGAWLYRLITDRKKSCNACP
ncbi:MAG: VanZ family protein [Deltaproteobacteria bacterium]|nr:VanZ family protein [Deltaproteobacteria bacterium]